MRSRLRRLVAAAVLTVCVGAPILEMADRWDQTLQDGNDTESNLVIVALCIGVGFVAARSALRRIRPLRTMLADGRQAPTTSYVEPATVRPLFGPSPPAVLRI